MTQKQDDLFQARLERDAAIKRAVDHADDVHPKWSEIALGYVERYCRVCKSPFVCDELREWAEANGLAEPPTRMAWGSVMVQAKKKGFIVKVGFIQGVYPDRKNTHMQTVTQWKACGSAQHEHHINPRIF